MKATPVSGKFRFPFILAVLTGAAACSNTGAHASAYIIEQLTSNNYADRNPQINDSGYVVWSGFDAEGSDLEIMLYDGSMISPLTDNDVHDMYPKINNANHVVWQGYDSAGSDTEIFLYNGSATVSITANDYRDDLPQINNNGYVTWKAGYACNLGPCEIFLFDGITSKPISGDDLMVSAPRINDAGQVVWHGGQDCWFDLLFLDDCDIYLYDGSMVDPSPINNSAGLDWNPDINDSGHVVYKKIGYGIDLVVPGIYLYDGTAAEPISSSASSRPQINDSGQVVWSGYGDGDSDLEIFLYQGPSADPIKITVNIRDDKGPRINNKGQVAWYGYDSSGSDYEIYVFDGTSINPSPITNDSHDDLYPEINSDGCVVWQGWDGNDLEIYYACPAPSFDIAQADIFEFPWWKSEEYWGGDSRLTILPPISMHLKSTPSRCHVRNARFPPNGARRILPRG